MFNIKLNDSSVYDNINMVRVITLHRKWWSTIKYIRENPYLDSYMSVVMNTKNLTYIDKKHIKKLIITLIIMRIEA